MDAPKSCNIKEGENWPEDKPSWSICSICFIRKQAWRCFLLPVQQYLRIFKNSNMTEDFLITCINVSLDVLIRIINTFTHTRCFDVWMRLRILVCNYYHTFKHFFGRYVKFSGNIFQMHLIILQCMYCQCRNRIL